MIRNQMSGRLLAFVGLVMAAGALILATRVTEFRLSGLFLTWLIACLAGEVFWIHTPTGRGTISMALTINLAAVIALNPAMSFPAVGLSTLIAGIYPHRRPFHRALFNAAQSVVACAAAFAVLKFLAPAPDRLAVMKTMTTWPALFGAGAAFFFINTGLVAMAIALRRGQSFIAAWRENYGYGFELACTVALISLSGFVLMAYEPMGPPAILFLLPILAVLWWSSAREAESRSLRIRDSEDDDDSMRLAG